MANFNSIETVPKKYMGRSLYQWNPNVTLLRTNVEENVKIGEMIASVVNQAKEGYRGYAKPLAILGCRD